MKTDLFLVVNLADVRITKKAGDNGRRLQAAARRNAYTGNK